MTSSILPPRSDLAPCSPITQASASTTLDLPEPLGPTMQVIPGSSCSVVEDAKDLKPFSVRLLRYNVRSPGCRRRRGRVVVRSRHPLRRRGKQAHPNRRCTTPRPARTAACGPPRSTGTARRTRRCASRCGTATRSSSQPRTPATSTSTASRRTAASPSSCPGGDRLSGYDARDGVVARAGSTTPNLFELYVGDRQAHRRRARVRRGPRARRAGAASPRCRRTAPRSRPGSCGRPASRRASAIRSC